MKKFFLRDEGELIQIFQDLYRNCYLFAHVAVKCQTRAYRERPPYARVAVFFLQNVKHVHTESALHMHVFSLLHHISVIYIDFYSDN